MTNDFSQILTYLSSLERLLYDDMADRSEQGAKILDELRRIREEQTATRKLLAEIVEEQIASRSTIEHKIDAVADECRVLGYAAEAARKDAEEAQRSAAYSAAEVHRLHRLASDTEPPPPHTNGTGR